MNTILVTSTEEGTGKTAVALALALQAQERGETVGYMKPKGTRLQSAVGKTRDEDPMLARELLGLAHEMHEMEPIVYSPRFVTEAIRGREDPERLMASVTENFDRIAADADVVLVEGADDVRTGSVVDVTDLDLADALDAGVVLVSGYGDVRDVDDVLATAESVGDRLAGVLFNAVPDVAIDELTDDVVPFLNGRGVRVLGVLPRIRRLAGVSVEDLVGRVGADVLTTDASLDVHVERFTVGAMGANSALDKFRRTRNAVMISGGDRSELQTAALEASGIEGLMLTGGFRPPSAVLGRAEEAGVPVLLVQSDTRTTIDRVEDVLRTGRTRSEAAVREMKSLLSEGLDLDELLADGN
jgi:BioD-like phosphotransacetylase family protein